MKGKTRSRRHQNYIIKPFSGLHLSCGDLYERKNQTNHVKRVGKKFQKKAKPKQQKKKKINSKANSLPFAEEYVPHKHSVRHFATQPVNRNTRNVASPPKSPKSLASSNGVTTTHGSPLHDIHSSISNEVMQPSDRTEQHNSPDGAQTIKTSTHAGGNSEQLSSLPDSVADLLQVYQRTCELAEIKMASIAPLLDKSRSVRPTMVEHKMVMASTSEHKDYSDAAEVLPDAHVGGIAPNNAHAENAGIAGLVLTVKRWAAKMFKAQDRECSGAITTHEFRRSFQVLEQKLSNLVLPPESTEAVHALLGRVCDAVLSVANPEVDELTASCKIQYEQALSLFDEILLKESVNY